MKQVRIIFFEGISFVSKVIKKVTASRFSHVGYLINPDTMNLIECWNTDKLTILDYLSIKRFNRKMCWKYTNFYKHHTPGTPITILEKAVPDDVYEDINNLFEFIAEYNMPYDVVGILSRVNKKLNTKFGFYCSEGVQNVLRFVQNKHITKCQLTDDIPGYMTDPGKLYDILIKNGWVKYCNHTETCNGK